MPFNAAPAPSQMPPGFMMFPNQAAAMGPQQMMPAYGFPPAMAPMSMMPHAHAPQQGNGSKGLSNEIQQRQTHDPATWPQHPYSNICQQV